MLTFNRGHSKSFSFCISELLALCNVYMFTLEWPSLDNRPILWTKETAGKIPQDYHYLLFHCQHSLLVRLSVYSHGPVLWYNLSPPKTIYFPKFFIRKQICTELNCPKHSWFPVLYGRHHKKNLSGSHFELITNG